MTSQCKLIETNLWIKVLLLANNPNFFVNEWVDYLTKCSISGKKNDDMNHKGRNALADAPSMIRGLMQKR